MQKTLICALTSLLLFSAVASAQRPTKPNRPSAEAYIRESEAQWAESVASGDTTAIERILA